MTTNHIRATVLALTSMLDGWSGLIVTAVTCHRGFSRCFCSDISERFLKLVWANFPICLYSYLPMEYFTLLLQVVCVCVCCWGGS